MGPKLQRLTRESMQLNASMNNTIAERFNVGGALVVKLFGKHRPRVATTFSDRAGRVRDIGVQTAMYSRVLFVGARASSPPSAPRSSTSSAATSRSRGTIGVGTIAAFAVYVSQIYQPLTQLANARVDVLTALVSFERVFEVLDFPPLITEPPGAVDLRRAGRAGRVRPRVVPAPVGGGVVDPVARGGRRRHRPDDESAWILRDVSFTVAPGELVALVGPSGAGKTTSALLVPRIYDVSAGEVRVDGHDVRDYTLESLRGAVGMVMQDPHLFHDTIRGQPALRAARRHRRRAGRGVQGRAHPRPDRRPPRRLRHGRRRARLPDVGRREAAARHRPHAAQGPRGRDPRRGDVAPRLRVRAGDPARARPTRSSVAPRW